MMIIGIDPGVSGAISILENKKVIDFFNSTKDFKSAHECCKIQCGVKNG